MIGDHYRNRWDPQKTSGSAGGPFVQPFPNIYPTQDMSGELAKLKKEVEEMKELLKRAVQYDKDNNQPHCEQDDKIKFLKQVAEAVGVSLEDVFNKPGTPGDPLGQQLIGN